MSGNTYYLNLNPIPFELIKAGRKRVEMRLFDERRKVLQVGDYIEFTNNSTGEKLTAKILGLHTFKNFEELYAHYDKSLLGYSKDEAANPDDMLQYYSKEKIAQFGTLAIEIELIKKD